ncbi:hypothetical protein TanjilG_15895 [Lupinus angustifolius]|uniref:TORTIFOLIA1/SINE1-2 N-terminal domain-containing protein n=1 Tax=Lupinus angustifolius TaxID=3871 RepID=A0A4P1RGW1_LUPAN|nr:hypothetical protein TanjilG_15895 [Lupinus angustifolius]
MSLPFSTNRRLSLSGSPNQPAGASAHDLRQRVIACLNKLSDRDTLAVATVELESIAKTLTPDTFSTFISCIHNTDSSSRITVRKQCIHLLSVLSHFHCDALAPFLPKMIAAVIRRLRDNDNAVRSACVDATAAMSSQITGPPFSAAFLKPLMDALTQEQDANSQIGAALCLAAAVDAAPEKDVEALRRSALPKLGKFTKNDACKAKAAVLVLIGSLVAAGGAASRGVMNWLVPFLIEFLSSEDWTVRKAASEALGKVAMVEKDLASQHKILCVDSLQNRRFDKVKVVRETLNRALEMWKEVANASEDVSAPAKSARPSAGPDGDKDQCVTKTSSYVGSKPSQPKKTVPASRSPPSAVSVVSSIKREGRLKGNDKDSRMGISHRMDHEKFSDEELETPVSKFPSSNMSREDDIKTCDFEVSKPALNQNGISSRADIKRVLFSKMSDEKVQKFSVSKSRVVPCSDDDNDNADVTINHVNEVCESPQDAEDLSLIREQLTQIENQQSNLLDLLQRFIGSSQSGMNSLETRVHGLETALDEISYDLAVSRGRIPNSDATEDTCCKLPVTDFLSSKFWKKTEGRYSTSRFSSGSIASSDVVLKATYKDGSKEMLTTNNKRFQHRSSGIFVNPLAEIQSDLKGQSYKPKNIVQDAERARWNDARKFNGISPTTYELPMNQNTSAYFFFAFKAKWEKPTMTTGHGISAVKMECTILLQQASQNHWVEDLQMKS